MCLRFSNEEYQAFLARRTKQAAPRCAPATVPVISEEDEQRAVARLLDDLGLDWFHPPNGGGRWRGEGGKLKAQGVKKGVPDIVILNHPPSAEYRHHAGVVIELKRVSGGVVSPDQKRWLEIFRRQGFFSSVCKGQDEVIATLRMLGFV